MADITNLEAVRFCNERVRIAADKLAQIYFLAKSIVAEWYANDIGSLLPVDGGNVIDGSVTDGRHIITGNDATGLIVRLTELVADYEASNNAKLNTIMAVAVNTGA
jgi:hypothetical protein